MWDVKTDKLTFHYSPKNLPNTKRHILSLFASIFEPSGIVTPAVLKAKLITQSLWKLKVDWDNNICKDILQRFQQSLSELHHMKEISIRCCFSTDIGKESDREFHI